MGWDAFDAGTWFTFRRIMGEPMRSTVYWIASTELWHVYIYGKDNLRN